jgi:hypothetical protein
VAIIDFDWAGYEYQTGLKALRDSYNRASRFLQEDIDQAYHEISMYDGRHSEEDDPNIDLDEDGVITFDPRDHLIHASLMAEQSMQALRKAYAIMIYHHWERGAREWGGKDHGGFSSMVKAAQYAGKHVDPEIVDLLILVNTLKHNASIWGQPLYDMHPDWFGPNFRRDATRVEWFDAIQISDAIMSNLFAIAVRSGPASNTVFV